MDKKEFHILPPIYPKICMYRIKKKNYTLQNIKITMNPDTIINILCTLEYDANH